MPVLSPDSLRLIVLVGGIGFVVVMRDVNQRRPVPFLQAGQHAQQRIPALLVDHAGDLVGDEQRRLARQRRGNRQPLQFTARQTAGVAFGVRVEADLAEQPTDVDWRSRAADPTPRRRPPGCPAPGFPDAA